MICRLLDEIEEQVPWGGRDAIRLFSTGGHGRGFGSAATNANRRRRRLRAIAGLLAVVSPGRMHELHLTV